MVYCCIIFFPILLKEIIEEFGLEDIMLGMVSQIAEREDTTFVSDLRGSSQLSINQKNMLYFFCLNTKLNLKLYMISSTCQRNAMDLCTFRAWILPL